MARKASSPTNPRDFREEPRAIVAGAQGKGRVAGFRGHADSGNDDESVPVKEREHGGIRVRVKRNHLDADVTVLATGDISIPELGRTIQAKVGTAAEPMLGMTVGTINVHVAGIQPAATNSTTRNCS